MAKARGFRAEVSMISLRLILLLVGLILLILSAIGVPSARVNLQSAGLAFWLLAIITTTTP